MNLTLLVYRNHLLDLPQINQEVIKRLLMVHWEGSDCVGHPGGIGSTVGDIDG